MMMEPKKILEEKLREAACFGDMESLRELLSRGVDINSKNEMNGWTALHWAAHRNHLEVVKILVENGADKGCLTNKGESPFSLSSNREVQIFLEGLTMNKEFPKLPITPSYLKNPSLCIGNEKHFEVNHDVKCKFLADSNEELVLKLRLADCGDPDFIEVELPKSEMTYSKLLEICCNELNISSDNISKIRKLPNTILRKDKDVQRLKDFQEVEVVLSNNMNYSSLKNIMQTNSVQPPVSFNRNQYESISLKKDQTVLY